MLKLKELLYKITNLLFEPIYIGQTQIISITVPANSYAIATYNFTTDRPGYSLIGYRQMQTNAGSSVIIAGYEGNNIVLRSFHSAALSVNVHVKPVYMRSELVGGCIGVSDAAAQFISLLKQLSNKEVSYVTA